MVAIYARDHLLNGFWISLYSESFLQYRCSLYRFLDIPLGYHKALIEDDSLEGRERSCWEEWCPELCINCK